MRLDQINLQETMYGKGFRGTLEDLLNDVFNAGSKNHEQNFEDNEYSKIDIALISIKD